MPRITEQLTLTTTSPSATATFKAVRPQNGQTPAMWRNSDEGRAIGLRPVINLGVISDTSANRDVTRVNLSYVQPLVDLKGEVLQPNRVTMKVRIDDTASTSASIDELHSALIAMVLSAEFAAALRGDQQF